MKIANSRVTGGVNAFGFNMGGLSIYISNTTFCTDTLVVRDFSVTLPSTLGGVGVSGQNLTIGPAGFTFGGAGIKLPPFAFAGIGVRNAQLRFIESGDGYLIGASAKLGFKKFELDGGFTMRYEPPVSLSLRTVTLTFAGTIPGTAIPVGQTGLYITRVDGSFDLTSGTLQVHFGLQMEHGFRFANVSLVTINGSVDFTADPFRLEARGETKLLGFMVSQVVLTITQTSFTLTGELEAQIIRATLELAFGIDAEGEFTFTGTARMEVGLQRGSIACWNTWILGTVCVPSGTWTLGRVSLGAGKYRYGGSKVWGAKLTTEVLGFDIYVFARLTPNPALEIGRNLNAYTPVRPQGVAAAVPGRDEYQVQRER